jgi:hypothetical protein
MPESDFCSVRAVQQTRQVTIQYDPQSMVLDYSQVCFRNSMMETVAQSVLVQQCTAMSLSFVLDLAQERRACHWR